LTGSITGGAGWLPFVMPSSSTLRLKKACAASFKPPQIGRFGKTEQASQHRKILEAGPTFQQIEALHQIVDGPVLTAHELCRLGHRRHLLIDDPAGLLVDGIAIDAVLIGQEIAQILRDAAQIAFRFPR